MIRSKASSAEPIIGRDPAKANHLIKVSSAEAAEPIIGRDPAKANHLIASKFGRANPWSRYSQSLYAVHIMPSVHLHLMLTTDFRSNAVIMS